MESDDIAGPECCGGPVSPESSLLVNAIILAGLIDKSVRSVWRDNAAGRLPRPVRIGGAVRWRRAEILDWVEAGCPDRRIWERTKKRPKSP